MEQRWASRIAGGAAGLANGLFGGGGGMVFLPMLSRGGGISPRPLYATCGGVIFAVCLVSAAVYLLRGSVPLSQAAPYLAGGLVGVIFPVCLVSAGVYVLRGGLSLWTALPYLAGGLVGGFLGGKLYGKVPAKLLKWLFAAFLFYAGGKYLL